MDKSGHLSRVALLAYIHGELSPALREEADAHIAKCEFCSDALEGLKLIENKNRTESIIADLNRKIDDKTGIQRRAVGFNFYEYRKIAASLAGLIIIASIVLMVVFINKDSHVASRREASEERPIAEMERSGPQPMGTGEKVAEPEQQQDFKEEEEVADQEEISEEQAITKTPVEEEPEKKVETTVSGGSGRQTYKFNSNSDSAELKRQAGYGKAADTNTIEAGDTFAAEPEAVEVDADAVYDIVEEMPEFPGGKNAMLQYIRNNLEYPRKAKRRDIEGKVYVSFVIDKSGNVTDVKVVKGDEPELYEAAIEVVKSMPRWTPGKQRGVPVKVKYILPIKFELGEE